MMFFDALEAYGRCRMNVYTFDLDQPLSLDAPISACIGYFDGLHKGHQVLVEHVVSIAKKTATIPALITFSPDPWVVLQKLSSNDVAHITPMQHRIEIGEQLGIQVWVILKFNAHMANISYQDFHTKVLLPLQIHTLVCGFDFHYAHKGEGSIQTLRQQSFFQVDVVEEISSHHRKISSSYIEECLYKGDMETVAAFMGRYYEMRGVIKQGNRLGTGNGYPTANLALSDHYIIPKLGVYIGSVKVDNKWHRAIINIGHNPTFNYQEQTSIEAHILDFNAMLYGKNVAFRFHRYIRGEQKFKDAQALIEQLHNDEQAARDYVEMREENITCD